VNSDLDKGIERNLDTALIEAKLHDNVRYEVKNHDVTLTGRPGKKVLVSPAWVDRMSWEDAQVYAHYGPYWLHEAEHSRRYP
jgi:hypothetical protein